MPPEIVVGIVGVETFYGRRWATSASIDALATLAFDFPTGRSDRSAFFRDELEAVPRAVPRREGLEPDPLRSRARFAGAIGLPQFMPGSINRYAVDFDGDGRIDLQAAPPTRSAAWPTTWPSSAGSAAWPTHFEVARAGGHQRRAPRCSRPTSCPASAPSSSPARRRSSTTPARAHDGPLALVELQNGDAAPSYVAGTQNFYAVTRYNWSSYYAMAVITLGEAVKRQR